MDDRLERRPPFGIGEHDPSQRTAVERAVAGEDARPELLDDGREPRRTGGHDLAGERVGVDHDHSELAQDARHRALARRDPAGEPYPHDDMLPEACPGGNTANHAPGTG